MKILQKLSIFFVFLITFQTIYAAPAEYPGARGKPFEVIQDQIDAIETSIDEQVASLQAQIDELETQVLANSEDIVLLEQLHEAQDQLIAVLFTAVGELEHQVAANTSDIAALDHWNQLQDQMLILLNNRVNSLQQQVVANDNDIAALINYDATVQLLISALQSKVIILEFNININNGDIASLESEVTTIKSQITSLQGALASKQDRITGYCPTGYSIRVIYSNGTVSCEYDNVSTGVGTLYSISRFSSSVTVPTRSYRSAIVSCPSGYRITGGGFDKSSNSIIIFSNYQWYNGWRIYVYNTSRSYDRVIYATATCSRVQ